MSINSKMTSIADAIRSKTDINSSLTLDQMAEAIANIVIKQGKIVSSINCATTTSSGVFFGDVNNDGIIDYTDLELIGTYVLEGGGDIDTEAADFDGNGIINNGDMIFFDRLLEGLTEGQLITKVVITYNDGTSETFFDVVDAPTAELNVSDDGKGNVEITLSRSLKAVDDGMGNVTIA